MKKILCGIMTVVLALMLLVGCSSSKTSNDELSGAVIDNITANLTVFDKAYSYGNEGLDLCDQFIDGDIKLNELTDALLELDHNLENCQGAIADDELKEKALSDDRLDGELAMGEFIDIEIDDITSDLDYLLSFLEVSVSQYGESFLHDYVNTFREEQKCYSELIWLEANNYLLGVGNTSEIEAFIENAKELPAFTEISESWSNDKEKIQELEELRYNQLDALLQDKAVLLGDQTLDLNQVKADAEQVQEDYIEYIMNEYSVSRETAVALVELSELEMELEEQRQIMREKFAPSADNDSGTLIGKAAKFARVKMYDEAVECMDVFLSKEEDPECPLICGKALKKLYSTAEETGIDYGILVTSITKSDGDYFKTGDIIIEIDSVPIYDAQAYMDTEELRDDGFEAKVLRLNSNGELEEVTVSVGADVEIEFMGHEVRESEE